MIKQESGPQEGSYEVALATLGEFYERGQADLYESAVGGELLPTYEGFRRIWRPELADEQAGLTVPQALARVIRDRGEPAGRYIVDLRQHTWHAQHAGQYLVASLSDAGHDSGTIGMATRSGLRRLPWRLPDSQLTVGVKTSTFVAYEGRQQTVLPDRQDEMELLKPPLRSEQATAIKACLRVSTNCVGIILNHLAQAA